MTIDPGLVWDETTLAATMEAFMLPFVRIGALLMVAPIFGSGLVPPRVRILLALGLAAILVPLMPSAARLDGSMSALATQVAQEVLLGVTAGFMVQMVFDAVVIGGQAVANSMGLGFAVMVDPQRGVNVPIVSQFLLVFATLMFLAIDGHLVLIRVLADSFSALPAGSVVVGTDGIWTVVAWGSQMFAGAIQIALPAVIALLVVNIAYGVISRSAPTLNLFAVGFPVTTLFGFLVLHYSFANIASMITRLLEAALRAVEDMVG